MAKHMGEVATQTELPQMHEMYPPKQPKQSLNKVP